LQCEPTNAHASLELQ